METKLSPAQWRAILGAARVGNLALQEGGEHNGPDIEASINSAFGELVRAGVIV